LPATRRRHDMKYILKPVPKAFLTVQITGVVRHDQGDGGIDTYLIEFTSPFDFIAFVEVAIRAMRDKTYIEIDHHHYHTYEMQPEKIMVAGTINRKFTRVHLNEKGQAMA
jgi:hypothetical protein